MLRVASGRFDHLGMTLRGVETCQAAPIYNARLSAPTPGVLDRPLELQQCRYPTCWLCHPELGIQAAIGNRLQILLPISLRSVLAVVKLANGAGKIRVLVPVSIY